MLQQLSAVVLVLSAFVWNPCCGGAPPRAVPWDQLLNAVVTVDGVAWDPVEKRLYPQLAMIDGRVYLHNMAVRESGQHGRLLRVTGVLRKGRMPEIRNPALQAPSESFEFYYLDVVAAERIEMVQRERLTASPSDWVARGMLATAALETIRARQMAQYPLQIAAPTDGSTIHSYRLDRTKALLFHEKDGFVTHVQLVEPNPRAKSGGRWTTVPAVRLAPLPAKNRESVPQRSAKGQP